MMRKLPIQLVVVVTGIALAITGCQSPRITPRAGAGVVPGQQSTPFLERGQYPDRVGQAIDDSLRRHGFTRPWIVARGPDASLWFVGERSQSEHRFDRIHVRVTPDQRVTARIRTYQFGPSDWAVLGTLVADYQPEADLISREITGELRASKR